MPLMPVARILVLLALAVGLFLAATGTNLVSISPEAIYLYGGPRTENDISSAANDAILASEDPKIHLVVQFERWLSPIEVSVFESRFGINILEAIPESAYVIAFPAKQAFTILDRLENADPPRGGVITVRPIDKLSPNLGEPGNLSIPEHAVRPDEKVAVTVHFFGDVPESEQRLILFYNKAEGIEDGVDILGKDNRWQVVIPESWIEGLLKADELRWVESVPAPPAEDLASGATQVGAREAAGLDDPAGGGAGVLIAQWELCQPRKDHPGLAGRVDFGGQLGQYEPPDCAVDKPSQIAGSSDPYNPYDGHPTLVAGIMAGAPIISQAVSLEGIPLKEFYGMAAEARLRAYRVDDTLAWLPFDYEDAMAANATISQNSWGSTCFLYSISSPPFYREVSALYDTVSSGRDYLGAASTYPGRMLMVASAGNDGDETNIPSLWGSARVSNSAKNVLMVGNVNAQAITEHSNWAHFSSGRGPTTDGRLAPVLSAPGVRFITQDTPHGIRSTYPPDPTNPPDPPNPSDWFKRDWGTSFSTPVVSGAAARVTEVYRNTCDADPSPSTVRALLIHTAHDLKKASGTLGGLDNSDMRGSLCGLGGPAPGFTGMQATSLGEGFGVLDGAVYEGPDYIFGYGLVQAERATEFTGNWHFLEDEISGGIVEYSVNVNPSVLEEGGRLRVTLVWDDPPWPVNVPPGAKHGLLQNDLDLELIDPSGRRHLPWVLDPDNPAQPAKQHSRSKFLPVSLDVRDQRNTIEQVVVEVPEFGTWKIHVRAGLMIRPPQSFTLVSHAIFPATACVGLPSRVVQHPFELPDSWLWWWLLWLAVLVLVLLVLILLWLIWKTYQGQQGWQSPWLHMLLALVLLVVVFYLVFAQLWLVLGGLMLLGLILALLLN